MRRRRRYYVYILTNPSRRPCYTGITNDLERRIAEHRDAWNTGCTRKYNLNRLVYYETFRYVGNAIRREKQIKGLSHAKKRALIESANPQWDDLSREWGKPIKPI